MARRRLIVEVVGDSRSVERSFLRTSKAAGRLNRDVSAASRGALAGSGVFRSLGRSIAFASGGFLAFATAGQFIRKSIDAAKEAAVVQAQLAAQFKSSGVALGQYQKQIDDTANRLSALAGFENDELKAAFITVFRTTSDVGKSLRDLATVTDLARAKHLALSQAALIVAKTEAGNTTLLRRQGFQIAKNATSEQALATLRKAVAGQAQAGTTAQERFGAVLHETEQIIGGALLPTLNKYLTSGARWLDQMNRSGGLQRDVATATRTIAAAFTALRTIVTPIVKGFELLSKASGGTEHAFELLAASFLLLRSRAALIRWGIIEAGISSAGTAAAGTAVKMGALRTALTRLAAIGTIAIAVEIILNRKKLDQQVTDALRSHGLGFLTGKQFQTSKQVEEAAGKPGITGALAQKLLAEMEKRGLVDTSSRRAPIRGIDVPSRFAPTPPASVARKTRAQTLQARFNLQELRLAQAQAAGNIAAQNEILTVEAGIVRIQAAQAKTLKKKTELTQRLAGLEDQIRSLDQQTTNATKATAEAARKRADAAKKAAAKARVAAQQFAVPLQLQVDQARLEALGQDVKPILSKIKAAATKALKAGKLGLQGQIDAWNTIASINDQLKTSAGTTKSLFRKANLSSLTKGLGLDPATVKALQARLSQIGPGGTVSARGVGAFGVPVAVAGGGTIVVQHETVLDGRVIEHSVTRHKQKRDRRNPPQRRGPFAGGGL